MQTAAAVTCRGIVSDLSDLSDSSDQTDSSDLSDHNPLLLGYLNAF
jgi:hypothetical protein